jgi:hypothetical protein
MTNDELLQKLLSRLKLDLDGLILDTEQQNAEYEEDTDDYTEGYIAGVKYVINVIGFVQDKTISL